MKIAKFTLLYLTAMLWITSSAYAAVAGKDKPYVDHLARYVITGWSSEKIPGAMPSARAQFKTHWFVKAAPRSRIGVLAIKQDDENSRRIAYYYKSLAEGAQVEAYEATIVKTAGSEYLIVDVQPYAHDMKRHLRKQFVKSLDAFDKLFTPVAQTSLDYRNNQGSLPDIERQLLTEEAKEALLPGGSRDEYHAIYKIRYEKNIVGYITGTPTCYGTPNSGLTIYMVDRKKIKAKGEGAIHLSGILVRENTCGDAGEDWHTEGQFIDMNDDGYLDIVTKQVTGGYDLETNKAIPTQEKAWLYLYKNDGAFESQAITPARFNELLGKRHQGPQK